MIVAHANAHSTISCYVLTLQRPGNFYVNEKKNTTVLPIYNAVLFLDLYYRSIKINSVFYMWNKLFNLYVFVYLIHWSRIQIKCSDSFLCIRESHIFYGTLQIKTWSKNRLISIFNCQSEKLDRDWIWKNYEHSNTKCDFLTNQLFISKLNVVFLIMIKHEMLKHETTH